MVALGVLNVIVYGATPASYLAKRTKRVLAHLGQSVRATCATGSELSAILREIPGSVWVLAAGAMPRGVPSAQLRADRTCIVGYTFERGELLRTHYDLEASTGGDFRKTRLRDTQFESIIFVAKEGRNVGVPIRSMASLVDTLTARPDLRFVHSASIDVDLDLRLRVGELVTSLHQGGAERVFLQNVAQLRACGHGVLPLVLDRAQRSTFPAPTGTVHLYEGARSKEDRLRALQKSVRAAGLDVVHAHLVDGETLSSVRDLDIPVVVTVHNTRAGWPAGYAGLTNAHATALLACSNAVARELRETTDVPVRILSNAIGDTRRAQTAVRPTLVRDAASISGHARVLACVANLRPQKRLDRVPAIVASLVARGQDAHALIIGEPLGDGSERARIEDAIAKADVQSRVHFLGPRDDVAAILAEANVFLSTSDFEGLSLAQLEAIDAGLALVVTDVGGAREVWEAHGCPGSMELVAASATPEDYADAVTRVLGETRRSPLALRHTSSFQGNRLAEQVRECVSERDGGLLLVTNNFATGGAQTSARRLLGALAASGRAVSAAVIEENPRAPTGGLRALRESGIVVHEARNARDYAPGETAQDVVDLVHRERIQTVVFWNVIAEHKIRIADALFAHDVYDVSPGEMYFASLDRYFQKPSETLPYACPHDYGALLRGLVVKYDRERAQGEHVLGTRVTVIPNGVPTPLLTAPRGATDRLVIGTVARLSPDKKLEELLSAFAMLRDTVPEAKLRVLGGVDGMHAEYARQLKASAPPQVHFEPETDGADAFLRTIDIFAMISEPAGCPNALLEAMAHGLPIVATDVGGAAQLVGPAAILTPRNDPDALARALVRLLRTQALREELSGAARARAAETYGLPRMRDRYAELFFPAQTSQ